MRQLLFQNFKSFLKIIFKVKTLRNLLFRLNLLINKDKDFEEETNLIRSLYPYKLDPNKLKENLDSNKYKFVIIIPPFAEGSGGHLNIFRFANFLEDKGSKVYLYINSKKKINKSKLYDFLRNNYLDPKFEFIDDEKINLLSFSGIIFSSWDTTIIRNKYIFEGQNFYFVQDYEPYFYNKGSLSVLAENSYKIKNINFIVAGDWIKKKLIQIGIDPVRIINYDFSVDKKIYFPEKKKFKDKNVLFYFRPGTARRMASIGIRALELLKNKFPNIKIKLIGDISYKLNSNLDAKKINTVHPDQLGKIYRSTNAVLVLGATNCSLLPIEIVACGTPVIMNRGENNEWLSKNIKSIYISNNDPIALAELMENVIFNDYEIKENIAQSEAKSVINNSWNDAYEPVWKWIKKKYEKKNN